ncbi:MAG: (2Fe-2S) ferredoxin domain-containing protein [Acidobacteriota bacterium]
MTKFERHVFICTNRRPDWDPKGSCAKSGSELVLAAFKEGLSRRALNNRIRANAAGCLDACADGPAVVVYPDGVWYGRVRPEDVEEIIEEHLVKGKPVERLRIAESL